MLIDDGLWRALYETKEKALAAIDTTQLRGLRKRATTNRIRKQSYFAIIEKAWSEDVEI